MVIWRVLAGVVVSVLAAGAFGCQATSTRSSTRRATPEEAKALTGGRERKYEFIVHRWEVEGIPWTTKVGPRVLEEIWFYGESEVKHRHTWKLERDLRRVCVWGPDGRLERQLEIRYFPERAEGADRAEWVVDRESPPWLWGQEDQGVETRDCRWAHFYEWDFDGKDLRRFNFGGATFDKSTFVGTNLEGARFRRVTFEECDLSKAANLRLKQVLEASFWDEATRFPEAIEKELRVRGLEQKGIIDF